MESKELQTLKENVSQQKKLDKVLTLIAKSAKDEFPIFGKLIQADVENVVMENALRENASIQDVNAMNEAINAVMKQIGKDIEKSIEEQFEAAKNKY